MIHPAVGKYPPLAKQLDEIKNGTYKSRSYYGKPTWTTPHSPDDIEHLTANVNRANQIAPLLMDSLCRKEIDAVYGGGTLWVFFVHNNTLRKIKYNLRGLWLLDWRHLIDILGQMEEIYNGP